MSGGADAIDCKGRQQNRSTNRQQMTAQARVSKAR